MSYNITLAATQYAKRLVRLKQNLSIKALIDFISHKVIHLLLNHGPTNIILSEDTHIFQPPVGLLMPARKGAENRGARV